MSHRGDRQRDADGENLRHFNIVLALVLLSVSVYLTIQHFYSNILVCSNNSIINCESVLHSVYASFLGIPLTVLALIWAIGIILILLKQNEMMFVTLLFKKKQIIDFIKLIWYVFGSVGVVYSIISQILVGYICIYCISIDILIILILGIDIYLHKKRLVE